MAIIGPLRVTNCKVDPEFFLRLPYRNCDLFWSLIGLIPLRAVSATWGIRSELKQI